MILIQEGGRIVRSREIRKDSYRGIYCPNEGPDPEETFEEREARIEHLRKKYAKEMARRKPGKYGLL